MEGEGVQFRTSVEVGVTVSVASLKENFDAIVMAGGAEDARRLEIPGAELPGVRLAMEFLTQQNKRVAGDDETRAAPRGTISAKDKHVIVIGGGDTGSRVGRSSAGFHGRTLGLAGTAGGTGHTAGVSGCAVCGTGARLFSEPQSAAPS